MRLGNLLRAGSVTVLLSAMPMPAAAQETRPIAGESCTTVASAPPSGPTGTATASGSASAQPGSSSVSPHQRPYKSLTVGEKFNIFVKQIYSPYTLGTVAFNAGIAQASGDWYSYGGGMEGYGKRYGASLANNESGVFFGWFLYPTIFHQDPRYPRLSTGSFGHRFGYAASRVLVTRNDSGRKQFNISHVLAAFTAGGLATSYRPRPERSFGDAMGGSGFSLLTDAGMNAVREFWPDIRRKLSKHEPKKLKRLEQSPKVEKLERAMEGVPPQAPPAPCPTESSSASPQQPNK